MEEDRQVYLEVFVPLLVVANPGWLRFRSLFVDNQANYGQCLVKRSVAAFVERFPKQPLDCYRGPWIRS